MSKWMTLPNMGHMIATRYQLVLVSLSQLGCETFFPLVGVPPEQHPPIIVIGHVQGLHFVQVSI
jgi:alpha-glucosidase